MMSGQQPIIVLKEGTTREKGKGAASNNVAAAKAIADAVRSTLGPRGMDKMLVDSMGDVVITNDGVTILKEVDVAHPAAKMLVEVAKTQDQQCGDGTTTAVILAGEFLKNAEGLLDQNVHPTVIVGGYRLAEQKAHEILEKISEKISRNDKEKLKKIATTAMMSKSASSSKDIFADIIVKAVMSITEETNGRVTADTDHIQIVKKHGGAISDTELIEGIIVDKERVHANMPKIVKNAKVALVDSAFEIKKTEVDAKINVTDPKKLQMFLAEEENILKRMVEKIKRAGANVLFCQKGIDDLAQHYLAKNDIYAVRRVKKSDIEKLARATGAKIVTRLDDLGSSDLGKAGAVEERKIADDNMTFVTKCKSPKAVSILIRGGTEHVVDEIERSLHDALSVVSVGIEDGKTVTGAGATAMEIADGLRDYAATVGGREQMAIDAFANAVEIVPRTLAENAGMDPIDTIIDLRKAHKGGKKHVGVDVLNGKINDMHDTVIEPIRVSKQELESATDAAMMILRIDDVIASKGSEKPPMPPGGMGGMGGMGGEY